MHHFSNKIALLLPLFLVINISVVKSAPAPVCSTSDEQFNLDVSCVIYQNQPYQVTLDFLPHSPSYDSLCWNLSAVTQTTDNGSCAQATDTLDVSFPCVDVADQSYKASLRYNANQELPSDCQFILDKAEAASVFPFQFDLIPSSGLVKDSSIKVEGLSKNDGSVGSLTRIIILRDDGNGTVDMTLNDQGLPGLIEIQEGSVSIGYDENGDPFIENVSNMANVLSQTKQILNKSLENPLEEFSIRNHTTKSGDVIVQCDTFRDKNFLHLNGEKEVYSDASTNQDTQPFQFNKKLNKSRSKPGQSVYQYWTKADSMKYSFDEWSARCEDGVAKIYGAANSVVDFVSKISTLGTSTIGEIILTKIKEQIENKDDVGEAIAKDLICSQSHYDQEVAKINAEQIVYIDGVKEYADGSKEEFGKFVTDLSIGNGLPTISLGPASPRGEIHISYNKVTTTETTFDEPVLLEMVRTDSFDSDDCAAYHWYIFDANDLVTPVADLGSEKIAEYQFNEGSWLIRLVSENSAGTYIDEKVITVANGRYIKISNSGQTLPDTAILGTGPNDWGCTQDIETGLIWELNDMYRVYDDWYEAMADNSQGFCGLNNWRMPTIDELKTLIYCADDQYNAVPDENGALFVCSNYQEMYTTFNREFFPYNTGQFSNLLKWLLFWSSDSSDADHAWSVNFDEGIVTPLFHKSYDHLGIRVSSGQ